MCNRGARHTDYDILRTRFGVPAGDRANEPMGLRPTWNLAPTNPTLIVRAGPAGPSISVARWGLVPKAPAVKSKTGNPLTNARDDNLLRSGLWRPLLAAKRCIMPFDEFYEWEDVGTKQKQRWVFALKNGDVMGFAGLWTAATDPATGEVVESAALITTSPNALLEPMHDRMPAILADRDEEARWLDPDTTENDVLACIKSYPADSMRAWRAAPITKAAGNGPHLLDPIA